MLIFNLTPHISSISSNSANSLAQMNIYILVCDINWPTRSAITSVIYVYSELVYLATALVPSETARFKQVHQAGRDGLRSGLYLLVMVERLL